METLKHLVELTDPDPRHLAFVVIDPDLCLDLALAAPAAPKTRQCSLTGRSGAEKHERTVQFFKRRYLQ